MFGIVFAIALSAIKGPFDDLEKNVALKPYQAAASRQLMDPPKGASVLLDKKFVLKSGYSDVKFVEVFAFQFGDPHSIKSAILDSQKMVQAATVKVKMPEFANSGFDISYMGNPTIVKADSIVGHVWVELRATRKQVPWNPKHTNDLNAEAAKNIRADSGLMKLVKSILPDLRDRAKKADKPNRYQR